MGSFGALPSLEDVLEQLKDDPRLAAEAVAEFNASAAELEGEE